MPGPDRSSTDTYKKWLRARVVLLSRAEEYALSPMLRPQLRLARGAKGRGGWLPRRVEGMRNG
jgi:hypothetical protein